MIQAETIAGIMGGDAVFHHGIRTLGDLAREVEQGLPKRTAREVGRHFFKRDRDITHEFVYRLIPEASYKRRKDRLTPEESARVERIARIVATAEFVWDDETDARHFLLAANPCLDARRPLDVAMSEIGARRVEALLWDIYYGHPA
jgi:putative toxin-antitoxin system antitoxin component (TIGR02293 family)